MILKKLTKTFYLALLTLSLSLTLNTVVFSQVRESDQANQLITFPEDPGSLKKIKKFNKSRLQLESTDGILKLKVLHLTALPKQLKKVQLLIIDTVTSKTNWRTYNRKFIKETIVKVAQHTKINDSLIFNPPPSVAKREADINDFINGKTGAKSMQHQWHTLVSDKIANGERIEQIRLKTGIFKKITFATTVLPSAPLIRLPSIDNAPCQPFNRFYERKKLAGYGLENIRYKPYLNADRQVSRKTFSIYFEKNKSEAKSQDYQKIIDYLKENNLSIVRASIAGFSSVEGDSVKNAALHKKRAQRLIHLLEKQNNETITLDTLILAESWADFRGSIKKSSYKWLDTLSNESIKKLINNDPELLNKLEPYLESERKASIQLVTSKKLTTDEMLDMVRKELANLGFRLNPNYSKIKDPSLDEAKAMGIFKFYEKMIKDDKATYEDFAKMIDENIAAPQLTVLGFYHFIKTLEEDERKQEGVLLDSLFSKRNWNNLFLVANNSIITLIKSEGPQVRNKRIRQAVDVQYYTYKYIQEGILDPKMLCSFDYPNEPIFYGFKLQHYAMLQLLSESFSIDCISTGGKEREIVHNKGFGEEEFQTFLEQSIAGLPVKNPENDGTTFDSTLKGDHYYFLKTLFITNDKSIQQFVQTSDNLIEFDLYHLLNITVGAWNPIQNHYYDKDIQFKQIDQLIRKLKSVDQRICDKVINQLYLDYHLKAMQHLQLRFSPGDMEAVRISDDCLKFISDYYSKYPSLMFPSLTKYIVNGLNFFYWLPSKKPSTLYSHTLIKSLKNQVEVSEEVTEMLSNYDKIYPKESSDKSKSSRNRRK